MCQDILHLVLVSVPTNQSCHFSPVKLKQISQIYKSSLNNSQNIFWFYWKINTEMYLDSSPNSHVHPTMNLLFLIIFKFWKLAIMQFADWRLRLIWQIKIFQLKRLTTSLTTRFIKQDSISLLWLFLTLLKISLEKQSKKDRPVLERSFISICVH